MGTLLQDLRYGLRIYTRSISFTIVTVLTLALGIGASTAVFSLVDALLLNPLPYPDSGRIVMPWRQAPQRLNLGYREIPWGRVEFQLFSRESKTFDSLGAFQSDSFNFTGAGDPIRLDGLRASAGFFPALGVSPALGRIFAPEEDQPGHEYEVLLSYEFWRVRGYSWAQDSIERLSLHHHRRDACRFFFSQRGGDADGRLYLCPYAPGLGAAGPPTGASCAGRTLRTCRGCSHEDWNDYRASPVRHGSYGRAPGARIPQVQGLVHCTSNASGGASGGQHKAPSASHPGGGWRGSSGRVLQRCQFAFGPLSNADQGIYIACGAGGRAPKIDTTGVDGKSCPGHSRGSLGNAGGRSGRVSGEVFRTARASPAGRSWTRLACSHICAGHHSCHRAYFRIGAGNVFGAQEPHSITERRWAGIRRQL